MNKRISSRVPGVKLHILNPHKDRRGALVAGEFETDIGFNPKRYFMVFDVPGSKIRGQHAHKKCHQFLVCVKGSLKVQVTDGSKKQTYTLDKLNLGLHIPPGVWCVHYGYQPSTVLLVFCSHPYDARDYIRDYKLFLSKKNGRARRGGS